MTALGPFLLLACALVLAVLVALSGLRRARHHHDAAAAQLRIVQQGLTEAIQVFDRDGRLISMNPAADRIFETERDETTRDAVTAKWMFIREDRTPLEREWRPLGVAMRTGVSQERVTVGIRKHPDASIKWLSMSTFPIRGRRSQIYGYVSCAWDITEKTRTSRELAVLGRASARLSSSLVPSEVALMLIDAAAELCSAPGEPRRRAELFTIDDPRLIVTAERDPDSRAESGPSSLPLVDHPYVQRVIATRQAVVAELHYEEFGPAVADAMRRRELKNCAWVPVFRGSEVVAVVTVAGRQHAPIDAAQLERLTTLVAMGELALNNAQAHERVAELARTDPLTGMGNRRALDERLAQVGRSWFALVAIDVDHLKRVNDTYGHPAGDQLIASVAVAMAAQLRPSDLLARVGGDEFMAVLIDCDAAGAIELGKRLQAAAALVPLPWGSAGVSVGSAAGVPGASPHDVAAAADVALYAAKQLRPSPAPIAAPAS